MTDETADRSRESDELTDQEMHGVAGGAPGQDEYDPILLSGPKTEEAREGEELLMKRLQEGDWTSTGK